MDIREILLHIRAGSSNRQVERDTKIDRRTIKRYKDWAKTQGLLEGPLPSLEELQVLADQTVPKQTPPQNVSSVAPYRDLVEQLVKENVEIAAIKCRLEERGYIAHYTKTLLDGAPMPTPFAEEMAMTRAALALHEAAVTGRRVTVRYPDR